VLWVDCRWTSYTYRKSLGFLRRSCRPGFSLFFTSDVDVGQKIFFRPFLLAPQPSIRPIDLQLFGGKVFSTGCPFTLG